MVTICLALPASLFRFGMFAPRILLWEMFVSLALMGYGMALLRALKLQEQPLAVSACAGVSIWMLLGGWLNLTHLASRHVLILFLACGALLFAREMAQKYMRTRIAARLRALSVNNVARNAAIPIAVYFLLVFAAHLRPVGWNRFDDPQAYMGYADKAAAFSSLQSDPFSERRTNTGLGGGTFLNVTMLAGADDSTMGYIDGAFGYLVYILSIWSVAGAIGLTGRRTVALLYCIPLFTLGKLNLTIVYLSTTFFMVMLLLLLRLDWEKMLPPRVALLLGLLLGASCTLKSSNIPFSGLLLGLCGIGFALSTRSPRKLLAFLLPAVTIAAVVLPWMLQLHRDQGTYLFPNLGRGYHTSAYGLLPLPARTAPVLQSLFIASPILLILLGSGVLVWFLSRDRSPGLRIPILSFFVAALLSTLLVAVSIASESIDRFSMPVCAPCLLLLIACALLAMHSGRHAIAIFFTAAFTFASTVFFSRTLRRQELLYNDIDQIWTLAGHNNRLKPYFIVLDPGTMQRNAANIRRAQDAVPPGETVLEATETAYGYDWRRNPVYIADYPGMGGLPPGPPIFSDAESLRLYLLGCGIHYVIYDRSLLVQLDFENFRKHPQWTATRGQSAGILKRSVQVTPWGRMEYYIENHTRLQFEQLAARHPVVYDDGRIEVFRIDK